MAVYGLWQSANGAGRVLDYRRLSNRLQQLTAGTADDDLLLEAHHSAWATCLFAGEPVAAQELSKAGLRLYDPERHRSHRLLYAGHDPGVCGSSRTQREHRCPAGNRRTRMPRATRQTVCIGTAQPATAQSAAVRAICFVILFAFDWRGSSARPRRCRTHWAGSGRLGGSR
jgi:hypothetical protein